VLIEADRGKERTIELSARVVSRLRINATAAMDTETAAGDLFVGD